MALSTVRLYGGTVGKIDTDKIIAACKEADDATDGVAQLKVKIVTTDWHGNTIIVEGWLEEIIEG